MSGLTIAQMRARTHERPRKRSSTTMELCLAQDLISEVERLSIEKADLLVEAGRTPQRDPDEAGPPQKASRGGSVAPPRLAEIDTRLAELYDEMHDHTGQLTLEAEEAGKWRQWVDANPPRMVHHEDSDQPTMMPVDQSIALGWCNAAALLERLGDFASEWNGEPVTADDWKFITATAAPGDLKQACRNVVQLHEQGGQFAPKSRKPSSATESPAPS